MKTLKIPYIVKPDTLAAKTVEDWNSNCRKFLRAANKFAKKHGATSFWENGMCVTGLYYEDLTKVPAYMHVKKSSSAGQYTPHGRSKKAKLVKAEMKELPKKWNDFEFADAFGGYVLNAGKVTFPSLHIAGGHTIICIPAREKMPDIVIGCEEILTSKFSKILIEQERKENEQAK